MLVEVELFRGVNDVARPLLHKGVILGWQWGLGHLRAGLLRPSQVLLGVVECLLLIVGQRQLARTVDHSLEHPVLLACLADRHRLPHRFSERAPHHAICHG